jgi:hypothetical protein
VQSAEQGGASAQKSRHRANKAKHRQHQQQNYGTDAAQDQHNMGLMDDASKHYVTLMEQIENSTDKETQNMALNMLHGHILVASRHREGCRAVQAAFDVAEKSLRLDLTRELHGHVCELIQSPSGNYVIQKVIEVLPTSEYRFVLSELAGNVKGLAQHRFGCRIFCRLLEHSGGTPSQELDLLLDELLVDVVEACKAPFAHYAVDAVLEHGTHVQRRQIGEALKGNLWKLANHKHASHIIEKAFGIGEEHCPVDIQLELVQELIFEGPKALEALATKRYGHHVMMALAKFVRTQGLGCAIAVDLDEQCLADEQCLRILTQLAQSPSLARTKAGQRFLGAMFGTCKTSDSGQSFSD